MTSTHRHHGKTIIIILFQGQKKIAFINYNDIDTSTSW
jgi:hypothetical protein